MVHFKMVTDGSTFFLCKTVIISDKYHRFQHVLRFWQGSEICDNIEIKMRLRRREITIGGGLLPIIQYSCLLSVYYILSLPTVSQKSRNCDVAIHTRHFSTVHL